TCLLIPTRHPPAPSLFPYTTLFRSRRTPVAQVQAILQLGSPGFPRRHSNPDDYLRRTIARALTELQTSPFSRRRPLARGDDSSRSEEHTSELQSPYDLVCRLLLEKK